MKKAGILLTVLVLTLSVFTGCGCRNSKPMPTTVPTTMPTQATTPSTQATAPTTAPTQAATDPTIADGNGPMSTDSTTSTDDTTAGENSRSRGMVGGNNKSSGSSALPGGTGSGNGITGSIS